MTNIVTDPKPFSETDTYRAYRARRTWTLDPNQPKVTEGWAYVLDGSDESYYVPDSAYAPLGEGRYYSVLDLEWL